MDPRHYDRIADLLCQIRANVENNLRTTTSQGAAVQHDYIMKIYALLTLTDALFDLDKNELL